MLEWRYLLIALLTLMTILFTWPPKQLNCPKCFSNWPTKTIYLLLSLNDRPPSLTSRNYNYAVHILRWQKPTFKSRTAWFDFYQKEIKSSFCVDKSVNPNHWTVWSQLYPKEILHTDMPSYFSDDFPLF